MKSFLPLFVGFATLFIFAEERGQGPSQQLRECEIVDSVHCSVGNKSSIHQTQRANFKKVETTNESNFVSFQFSFDSMYEEWSDAK